MYGVWKGEGARNYSRLFIWDLAGARGRFASLEADRRRHGRAQLKVEQDQALRDREKVSVGPLLN